MPSAPPLWGPPTGTGVPVDWTRAFDHAGLRTDVRVAEPAAAAITQVIAESPVLEQAPAIHRRGTSNFRRFASRLLLGATIGLIVGLLAGVSLPGLLGYHSLAVMSGSMEPAIQTGDLVIVETIPADQIVVGDVVSFRSPEDPSLVITHRVHSVTAQPGGFLVVTQGDANTGTETWNIDHNGTVGRVKYQVPRLGYLFGPLQGRIARLLLVAVPAVLLALLLVVNIWQPAHGEHKKQPHRARRSVVGDVAIHGGGGS